MMNWVRGRKAIALVVLLMCLAAAGPAGVRAGEEFETLVIPAGESRIIAVQGLERVAVTDPTVADVLVATAGEVIVYGNKAGKTSLHLWEDGRRRSLVVRVEEPPAPVVPPPSSPEPPPPPADERTREEERRAEQERQEQERKERERKEQERKEQERKEQERKEQERREQERQEQERKEREEARRAAERDALSTRVEQAVGLPTVKATLLGDVLLVDGTVPDEHAAKRAGAIAEALGAGLVTKVALSLLVAPAEPPQVLLQVQVMEIANDSLSQLGITWGGLTPDSEGKLYFDPSVQWIGEVALGGDLQRLFPLRGRMEAMLKEGTAKLLAAPSILTRSGKQAEFLAGGEFPVVVYDKDGYTIYWKEYGVKLSMLPEVRADEVILVHLKPEVSTLDWANAAKLSSGAFPALKTRRAEADVRLRDGATLVIGGLLRNEDATSSNGLPFLSKLPIIGHLFASKGFQQGQTQLVFFVTPRLIRDGESPTAGDVTAPAEQRW